MIIIVYILFVHFIADFVLQSHTMAMSKSKHFRWLLAHIAVYTAVLSIGTAVLFDSAWLWFLFTVVTGVTHLAIDFVTSKINKWLWDHGQVHNFFVGVGIDQFAHQFCLLLAFGALQ